MWQKERSEDITMESRRIVEAAAKLIRAEIREAEFSKEDYPLVGDISTAENGSFVPTLLRLLMGNLIHNKLKAASLSHAIIQAARQGR